jgi:adenylosuccinate synthase
MLAVYGAIGPAPRERRGRDRGQLTPKLVILLSGHVSAGKTTLAHELATRVGFAVVFSSRSVLEDRLAPEQRDRRSLQLLGESLDRDTGGRWLSDALAEDPNSADAVIVDAVRVKEQVSAFEGRFTSPLHVHLKAPRGVLEARYSRRQASQPDTELASYEDVLSDPTEAAVDDLAADAALVVDTYHLRVEACALIVMTAVAATGALREE